MTNQTSDCKRTQEPAALPVTVAELRAHLRLSGSEEDALLDTYLRAAVDGIEQKTRRALITQRWSIDIIGAWGLHQVLMLPRPRLISVIDLNYKKDDQSSAIWTEYTVRNSAEPALIWLTGAPSGVAAPIHEEDRVWWATIECGYGASGASVPGAIKAAITLLAAHLFENREPVITGTIATELPHGIESLISPFRVPWGGAHL